MKNNSPKLPKNKEVGEIGKKEKSELAFYEKLILCPKCRNNTLLVSDKEVFNMCINVNCCYFVMNVNYLDSVGYNWEGSE